MGDFQTHILKCSERKHFFKYEHPQLKAFRVQAIRYGLLKDILNHVLHFFRIRINSVLRVGFGSGSSQIGKASGAATGEGLLICKKKH